MRIRDGRSWLAVAILLVATGWPTARAEGGEPPDATPRPSALLPIPNARIPLAEVLSGGQPTPDQIEAAARAGFRTVINLRSDGETGFEWEAETVERLGLRYVRIPVAGERDLTRERVEQLDSALSSGLERGPVLLHCASGNRIGAMLALRAAWLGGLPPDEALEFGVASGLTGLYQATSRRLGTAVADPAAAPRE
ncbi:MAG TPA: protein tyrosine phosphatase family protein [Candidatus Polarisedimenticolaceae bacterium]|nr:protein tyrosine phosphatase family protein [Candidatus Polarisedimenticolaceae bacterium]